MQIYVFARLRARPGRAAEVQQAMFEVQGPTRVEPGCLAYGGFRSIRDPDEFTIHSAWIDLESFERHAELPHTLRFLEAIEPLLDHPFKAILAEKLW
jgi:quinol monooxygenase YgiN